MVPSGRGDQRSLIRAGQARDVVEGTLGLACQVMDVDFGALLVGLDVLV